MQKISHVNELDKIMNLKMVHTCICYGLSIFKIVSFINWKDDLQKIRMIHCKVSNYNQCNKINHVNKM